MQIKLFMYLPGNPSKRRPKPRSGGQVLLIAIVALTSLLGTAFLVARSSSRPAPSEAQSASVHHEDHKTHQKPEVAATFKEPQGVDGGLKVVTETFSKEIKTPAKGPKPQPNQVSFHAIM